MKKLTTFRPKPGKTVRIGVRIDHREVRANVTLSPYTEKHGKDCVMFDTFELIDHAENTTLSPQQVGLFLIAYNQKGYEDKFTLFMASGERDTLIDLSVLGFIELACLKAVSDDEMPIQHFKN